MLRGVKLGTTVFTIERVTLNPSTYYDFFSSIELKFDRSLLSYFSIIGVITSISCVVFSEFGKDA